MLFKDIINPARWFAFMFGMTLKKRESEYTQPHIVEQFMFRMLICKPCVLNGKCIGNDTCEGCGCDTIGKMLLADDSCHCGNWGPYKPKDEWEAYKAKFGIKFLLELNNKIL